MQRERSSARTRARSLLGVAALGALLGLWLWDAQRGDQEAEPIIPCNEEVAERSTQVASERTGQQAAVEEATERRRTPGQESAPAPDRGWIRVEVHDHTKTSAGFEVVTARIDEASRELRVHGEFRDVHSPWTSEPLAPGAWRVCTCRRVKRRGGLDLLLEQREQDVVVVAGEVTTLRAELFMDPRPIGAIRGRVVSGSDEASAGRVALWDSHGRLIDGDSTRFFGSVDAFVFRDLPGGSYGIGLIGCAYTHVGWPDARPLFVRPPADGIELSVLDHGTQDWVTLVPKSFFDGLPEELLVRLMVDGKMLTGHFSIRERRARIPAPLLDRHDVRWLVGAKGTLWKVYDERDLLGAGGSHTLRLDLREGIGFALLTLESSLLDALHLADGDLLVSRYPGLVGVELEHEAEGRSLGSLGSTGDAGLLLGKLPWKEGNWISKVRPKAGWLVVVDAKGRRVTYKEKGLDILPLVRLPRR